MEGGNKLKAISFRDQEMWRNWVAPNSTEARKLRRCQEQGWRGEDPTIGKDFCERLLLVDSVEVADRQRHARRRVVMGLSVKGTPSWFEALFGLDLVIDSFCPLDWACLGILAYD